MPRGYSEGGEARECCTPLGPLHPPLAGLLRGRCGAATGSPQRRSHAGPHQPAPALSLHQAIAADPRNPLAKFERAAVLMAEDRWHDALAELRVLRVRRRRAAGRCTGKASAELGVPPAPAGGRLFLHRRGLDRRGWPLPLCGQHPVAPSFLGKAPPWLLGKRCRSRSSPLPRLPQRFAFCVVFLPTWSASSPPPGRRTWPPARRACCSTWARSTSGSTCWTRPWPASPRRSTCSRPRQTPTSSRAQARGRLHLPRAAPPASALGCTAGRVTGTRQRRPCLLLARCHVCLGPAPRLPRPGPPTPRPTDTHATAPHPICSGEAAHPRRQRGGGDLRGPWAPLAAPSNDHTAFWTPLL